MTSFVGSGCSVDSLSLVFSDSLADSLVFSEFPVEPLPPLHEQSGKERRIKADNKAMIFLSLFICLYSRDFGDYHLVGKIVFVRAYIIRLNSELYEFYRFRPILVAREVEFDYRPFAALGHILFG